MAGAKKKNRNTVTNKAAGLNLPPQATNGPAPDANRINAKASRPGAPGTLGLTQSKPVHSGPLTPKSPNPIPALDYKEVQHNEVEVLQSIWMEDYKSVVKTGAWNTSATSFTLSLRPSSMLQEDEELGCTLVVTMTATYPKTLPELKIINPKGLRSTELAKLTAILSSLPPKLVGQEMIHEIATAIQDALEDIVQMRKTSAVMPTFHDQRLKEEELKREQERMREEELRLQQEKADLEAERVMGAMVAKEKKKRREKAKEAQGKKKPVILDDDTMGSPNDHITFDREVTVEDVPGGSPLMFRRVGGMVQIARGPLTRVYTVKPVLQKNQQDCALALIMKCVELDNNFPNATDGKRQIQTLEIELDKLRTLRHSNIVELYESKVVSVPMMSRPETTGWKVAILMEHADKSSLRDLLETVGTLDVHIARSWTIQLLEGLDYIHSKGVFHMALHPGNVLLFKPSSGGTTTTAKLSDICFNNLLWKIRNIGKETAATGSASAFWTPPEATSTQHGMKPNRKADIWNLGVVFLQMVFGLDIIKKYESPEALMNANNLHESLHDFLERIFTADHKKRPTAFDLLPSEFLRNNDPVFSEPSSPTSSRMSWSLTVAGGRQGRQRLGSNAGSMSLSRYANDFSEVGRLGKGGFGEVVKARNRLDGRMYAVKKIPQTHGNSLTDILSEVMLLSRLNHQYVVRYFTAWLEDDYSSIVMESSDEIAITFEDDDEDESKEEETDDADFSYHTGTGAGLDFISSSGYPKIQFGYDSGDDSDEEEVDHDEDEGDDDSEDDDSDVETESGAKSVRGKKPKPIPKKTKAERRASEKGKVMLYIQMELCERQTLRDLLRHDLHLRVDECWRLLRQILEGLVHVHGLGIIHRDLKPDNIFIDVTGNPRIGDFGLATSGQMYHDKNLLQSDNQDSDLTTDVGTALYVAPELRSHGQGKYNEKVDMYSLGIIFFEMCHPLKTAMERDQVIRQLRQRDFTLPPEFQTEKKSLQGSIIKSLINHRPSERPTSSELLASGKLPLGVEDETMRQALRTFSDPNNPYHPKLMRVIFSQQPKEYKDVAYDSGRMFGSAQDHLLQAQVKERLISIFRRHGAVEVDRPVLFPRSQFYTGMNAVQLLDPTGNLLQLPFDLTLPNARALAREEPPAPKMYTFGTVYREKVGGGQPFQHLEVDFDIVSFDSLDLALKEAEVIKVIDEVVDAFPVFKNVQICYHISHATLLDIIMEFCRIDVKVRPVVKEVLSRLNTGQWTFSRIRNELRSSEQLTISATSLDELSRFDFRDEPDKAFQRLRNIFADTPSVEKCASVLAHIGAVVVYLKRFGVGRKVYVSPLGTFNDKFYRGGLVFQCLYDTKRRDVFAAGGRYDSLIQDHKPHMRSTMTGHHHHNAHSHYHQSHSETHAVGFSLSWERLLTSMTRHHRNISQSTTVSRRSANKSNNSDSVNSGIGGYGDDDLTAWATRRCDVLVASFDPALLRTEGVEVVQRFWRAEVKAELAVDAPSTEGLLQVYRGDGFGWIVILKAASPTTATAAGTGAGVGAGAGGGAGEDRLVKVKNLFRREDYDIKLGDLVVYLKADIAERERRVAVALGGSGGSVGEKEGGGGRGGKHRRR